MQSADAAWRNKPAVQTQFAIRQNDLVVKLGDSITASDQIFYYVPGVINSLFDAHSQSHPTWVNSGISGNKVHDLVIDVANRVTQYHPTIVVIQIGINDATSTAASSFNTDYRNLIAQIQAANPGVVVVCISLFTIGENWPDGANTYDSLIDALHDITYAAARDYGCVWIDARREILQWEAANNSAHVTSGLITGDGIHINGNTYAGLGLQWTRDMVLRHMIPVF